MDNENRYIVSKEKREKLGNYIKETRLNHIPNKIGLNELAEITNSSNSLISNIENGKIQRINPFLLQDIAKGLEIDYKILYRIVGFLNEEDSLVEEKQPNIKKSTIIIWEKNEKEVIDISSISKKGIEELKKYVKYLKIDFDGYEEFFKWKKEKKREYKIQKFLDEYMDRQEWNEEILYKIPYNDETVKILFEYNGLRLSEYGKEFYKKLVNFFGGEAFFEELKDENGNLLTGIKKEYQILKIVRYYATTVPLDFY